MTVVRVIALDPGEQVGWVTATVDLDHFVPLLTDGEGDVIETMPALTVVTHGITDLRTMGLAIHKAIVKDKKYDVVVLETYTLASGKAKQQAGSSMEASQFIGMVKLAVWQQRTPVVLVEQQPSAMATAVTIIPKFYPKVSDIIDAAPKSHDKSHDMSAIRHLVKWHWDKYAGVKA